MRSANLYRTRVIPSSVEWTPWPYQTRAVAHLIERGSAALFLDPGLGKTAITLEAFRQLKEAGQAKRMLVVAPLRVCQLVWGQEGRKWTQFRDLTFSLLHGPKKEKRLSDDVDIHLINPEGVSWLTTQFFGRSDLPWDIVVLDELTKFKNHRAQRSKKLRTKLKGVKRRWGLTGSPAPNGYMDLFGQMLILDDGAALGRYISYFRDQYFTKNWDGFTYDIRPESADRIEAKIAPYVLRMSAKDYLDLPPLTDHVIEVALPPDALRQYEEMKRDMILSLPEGEITAANAAAVYSKLKQLTNGAVYLSDQPNGKKEWVAVHDAKLDALEELIDELAGQPLLVAYEFQHDLARLKERLGDETPTLSGLSGKRIAEVEAEWNRGELPVLLVHPASAGHGLNLQGAGASHICWFSKPWDLEVYDQTIHRIHRQGSTSERVINHSLMVRGSIDEIVETALEEKDTTQNRLLDSLNAEILLDGSAPPPQRAQPKEEDMALKKLGFKAPASTDAGDKPIVPKGWGPPPEAPAPEAEAAPPAPKLKAPEVDEPKRPKGWGPPPEADEQREAVQAKIRAPEPEEEEEAPPSVRAFDAFPSDIVQRLNGAAASEAEEEEESSEEQDVWAGLSTRTANALKAAELRSPQEAYEYGKSELVANVPGFGAKGWQELVDLCEAAEEEAPPFQTPAPPAPTATAPAPAPLEPVTARATVTAPKDPVVPAKAAFSAVGVSADTLATLFESIAKLLRGA